MKKKICRKTRTKYYEAFMVYYRKDIEKKGLIEVGAEAILFPMKLLTMDIFRMVISSDDTEYFGYLNLN